jgi:hypothetical protein
MSENGWTHAIANQPEFAIRFGIITAEWSALELHLCFLFRCLLGIDAARAEAVFFTVTNNRSRREMVASLAAVVLPEGDELRNRVDRILRRIKNAAARRNAIAHSIWYFGEIVGKGGALSFERGSGRLTSGPKEIQELDQVMAQLRILRKDTHEVAIAVRDFLVPSIEAAASRP